MTTIRHTWRYRALAASLFAFALSASAVAQDDRGARSDQGRPELTLAALVEQEQRPQREPIGADKREKNETGWAFYVDNDAMAPGDTDRDYTGGFSLTRSGAATRDYLLSADRWLTGIDALLGVGGGREPVLHSVEWGFTAFTPEDTSVAAPQPNDRPYASLVYLSNTRQRVDPVERATTISTLTLGVLGLEVAADVQNSLHQGLDFEQAEGWENQISDGGEPTLRYSLTRQWVLQQSYRKTGLDWELQSSTKVNLGYLTDVSWSLSGRWGRLRTPWWSHNPQLIEYAEKAASLGTYGRRSASAGESYVWAGVALRARAYNAFLQGQFRASAVTYARDDLRNLLAEVWLGYTHEFEAGLRLSYVLRGQSAEIRSGQASRDAFWGGLIISRAF